MDKQIFILANMSARSPGPAQYILKPTIGIVSPDPTLKSNPVHSFNCRRSEKVSVYHHRVRRLRSSSGFRSPAVSKGLRTVGTLSARNKKREKNCSCPFSDENVWAGSHIRCALVEQSRQGPTGGRIYGQAVRNPGGQDCLPGTG